MAATVAKTPQARADLLQLANYIARDSLDAALRFLDAAEGAFQLLAQMPEIGTACSFRSPQADGIRVWSIQGFENYLVFYRPTDAGINVVRVIHGARDVESLFADDSRGS